MMDFSRTLGKKHQPLKIGAVLMNSLPGTLLSDKAPGAYRVAAVFNRQPAAEETEFLTSDFMRGQLDAAGYPDAVLSAANRRLEISNTSLEQLRDGLAALIARELALAGKKFEADRDERNSQFHKDIDAESQRYAAVQKLAESVAFSSAEILELHGP